ncbi:MAG: NUDIX domain-containing protein [Trueperaceae bacterium]|nr:NUDIX domain-containing protein [Trueperaceae bacterium]
MADSDKTLEETHVVTCFLRHRGEVLLLRRSEEVGSYQQQWGAVAGHAEGDPDRAARQEIAEESGLLDAATFVRKGEPFEVDDAELGKRWVVHPYLFDCAHRDVRIDWESTEAAWVAPTEILRRDTVPQLWTSYDRVAPSVASIRDDRDHGATYLSLRAIEVLRDRAGYLAVRGAVRGDDRDTSEDGARSLVSLAHDLIAARPSMHVLANQINRVMHRCREQRQDAKQVERVAIEVLEEALRADDRAARNAAKLVAGRRVLTLSRSGTVLGALTQAEPRPEVIVAASQPGGEGVGVAEALDDAGLSVTLIADAALAAVLGEKNVDLVLFGADSLLPSGGVVNKVGSALAALAARRVGIPCYAVTTVDKLRPDDEVSFAEADTEDLYGGDADLTLFNPLFEVVAGELITEIVTEEGGLEPSSLAQRARDLAALADWSL